MSSAESRRRTIRESGVASSKKPVGRIFLHGRSRALVPVARSQTRRPASPSETRRPSRSQTGTANPRYALPASSHRLRLWDGCRGSRSSPVARSRIRIAVHLRMCALRMARHGQESSAGVQLPRIPLTTVMPSGLLRSCGSIGPDPSRGTTRISSRSRTSTTTKRPLGSTSHGSRSARRRAATRAPARPRRPGRERPAPEDPLVRGGEEVPVRGEGQPDVGGLLSAEHGRACARHVPQDRRCQMPMASHDPSGLNVIALTVRGPLAEQRHRLRGSAARRGRTETSSAGSMRLPGPSRRIALWGRAR